MSVAIPSPWDGGDRRWLARTLAVVAVLDGLDASRDAFAPAVVAAHPLAPTWLLAHAAQVGLALAAVVLVAALAWWRRPCSLRWPCVVLVTSCALIELESARSAGPWRARFFVGAMILGAIVGRTWARRARAHEERAAEWGAIATLSACYLAAATSKLGGAGPTWIDATTLRAVALTHALVDAQGFTAALADAPGLARVLAGATVVVQLLGGLGLLVGGRTRTIAALALVGFHLGVATFARIGYGQPVVLLLAFGLPWPRWLAAARSVEGEASIPSHPAAADRVLALALVSIVVLAWSATPVRDYAAAHHRPRALDAGDSAPRVPTSRLGPLAQGDRVADWRVDELACEPTRAMVVLQHGQHGRVVLWVAGVGEARGSPFDRAHVSVAYETRSEAELPFAAAATIIADRLEAAASDGTSWCAVPHR